MRRQGPCPVCGRVVAITAAGETTTHKRRDDDGQPSVWCPGGRVPRNVVERPA